MQNPEVYFEQFVGDENESLCFTMLCPKCHQVVTASMADSWRIERHHHLAGLGPLCEASGRKVNPHERA